MTKANDPNWDIRIIGEGTEAPDQLLANPKNWRIHTTFQQDSVKAVLEKVGWVQKIIVNQRTNFVVDGHLRVMLALRNDQERVPVTYVDLSDAEEDLVLASLDPITGLAVPDQEKLTELMRDVRAAGWEDTPELKALLEGISIRTGLVDSAPFEAVSPKEVDENPRNAPVIKVEVGNIAAHQEVLSRIRELVDEHDDWEAKVVSSS